MFLVEHQQTNQNIRSSSKAAAQQHRVILHLYCHLISAEWAQMACVAPGKANYGPTKHPGWVFVGYAHTHVFFSQNSPVARGVGMTRASHPCNLPPLSSIQLIKHHALVFQCVMLRVTRVECVASDHCVLCGTSGITCGC